MKKRIVIAVVVVLAIVLIAQTSGWTEKLRVGDEAPVAEPVDAGARPQGTVITTGACPVALSADPANIGNVAEGSLPGGGTGEACVLEALPAGVASLDGLVDGSLIKLTSGDGETIPGDIQICYNVGVDSRSAFYWDGEGWVETGEAVTDGVLCVTAPADAPNPTYTALASK